MDLDTLAPEVQRFIKDISEENKLWEIKYTELKEKYDLVVFRKFGRSTESLQINNGQPSLFSEESEPSAVQNTGDEQPSESANEAQKIGSYTRAKAGRSRWTRSFREQKLSLTFRKKISFAPAERNSCVSERKCPNGFRLSRRGYTSSGLSDRNMPAATARAQVMKTSRRFASLLPPRQ